jgi:rare lipoprotein A
VSLPPIASALLVAGCAHRTYTTQAPAAAPQPQTYPSNPPSSAQQPGGQFPAPSGAPPAVERQPGIPGQYVEEGVASWYGVPFNGHRTSDGEIYDMYQLTAAHRTLPFGSIVQVTDLANGRQIEVRINDRGPFVKALGMLGPGTAPVRLDVVSGPSPAEGFFGVQIGAFSMEANAERLRAGLSARYSPVSVVPYDSPRGIVYRVRVGQLPTEQAAQQLAAQLRADEQLTTFVVRLN